MLYSKTTGGFYSREIHGDNIPADAIEITSEEHAALMQGQSQGKRITHDADGFPILIDPHEDVLTYQEELQILNAEYQKDVDVFNKAFSLAILFDGVSEEAKKASIREQYNNRKQKYVADIAALKLKHGV